MQRYFIDKEQIMGDIVTINNDDVHHIKNVMRKQVGDQVIVLDQSGKAFIIELTMIDEIIRGQVIEEINVDSELPINVTIGSALLRNSNYELMLQKATEMGAYEFIPMTTKRTVVKLDGKEAKKIARFQKIVKEAAEQSQRAIVPLVNQPKAINELCSDEYDVKLVAYEKETESGTSKFKKTLENIKPGSNVLIVFGPEGGFTTQEIELLEDNNFITVGLGKRILRGESAPLYALSAISYQFEK